MDAALRITNCRVMTPQGLVEGGVAIDDGRIVNELDTEYFIRGVSSRGFDYLGINYCPFCGRALSHGLWVAEKKK